MRTKLRHVLQIALASFFFATACSEEESAPPVLEVHPSSITMNHHEGSTVLAINGNVEWSLQSNRSWCVPEQLSGNGEAMVTILIQENTNDADRNAKLVVTGGNLTREIQVTQAGISASIDSTYLYFPAEGGEKQFTIYANREWEIVNSNDWLHFTPESGQDTSQVTVKTDANTGYEPRSAIINIQCGSINRQIAIEQGGIPLDAYADGEVRLYDENDAGNPVKIVFMGDGFTQEDLAKGGAYDRAMEEAIDAFFSTEPYPTYREYFAPYIVYAESEERGISMFRKEGDKEIYTSEKSTAFKVRKENGYSTLMNGDLNKIWEYAHKVPGLEDTKTTIVVVSNSTPYAGTCYHWEDGRTVSLIPMNRDANPPGGFDHLITHESAGHGFGRLDDEYSGYGYGTLPESEAQALANHHKSGQFWNVTAVRDTAEVYWSAFIGREGYEHVGFYEGAHLYDFGVWRCEQYSCMINNIHYFSVASRMAIVERLKTIAGETFDLEDFISKDKQKAPTTDQLNGSYTMPLYQYPPATPPIFVDESVRR